MKLHFLYGYKSKRYFRLFVLLVTFNALADTPALQPRLATCQAKRSPDALQRRIDARFPGNPIAAKFVNMLLRDIKVPKWIRKPIEEAIKDNSLEFIVLNEQVRKEYHIDSHHISLAKKTLTHMIFKKQVPQEKIQAAREIVSQKYETLNQLVDACRRVGIKLSYRYLRAFYMPMRRTLPYKLVNPQKAQSKSTAKEPNSHLTLNNKLTKARMAAKSKAPQKEKKPKPAKDRIFFPLVSTKNQNAAVRALSAAIHEIGHYYFRKVLRKIMQNKESVARLVALLEPKIILSKDGKVYLNRHWHDLVDEVFAHFIQRILIVGLYQNGYATSIDLVGSTLNPREFNNKKEYFAALELKLWKELQIKYEITDPAVLDLKPQPLRILFPELFEGANF